MTDRPILFSGPMVRAILDGRKTQTRRVLRPQIEYMLADRGPKWPSVSEKHWREMYCGRWPDGVYSVQSISNVVRYAAGDRLWVREKWSGGLLWGDMSPAKRGRCGSPQATEVHYWADGNPDDGDYWESPRSSIHMPRWASRLTLTVADVRIERLQDISEADARAEGATPTPMSQVLYDPFIDGFRVLWDSINAARGYGWDANPWVIAITFTAEQRNIDSDGGKDD